MPLKMYNSSGFVNSDKFGEYETVMTNFQRGCSETIFHNVMEEDFIVHFALEITYLKQKVSLASVI